MEKTSSKVNLAEELECTICLDPSVSPIHNCSNGHIVCGLCSEKMRNCGICEDVLIKCGLAERLVQKHVLDLPCKHFESGCRKLIRSTEMKAHLLLCEYRLIECFEKRTEVCPPSVLATKYFELNEYFDHLIGHHKTPNLVAKANGEFSWIMKSRLNMGRVAPIPVLCFKNDGLHFVKHIVHDKTAICCWITVLGGQAEADNYYYTTQITCAVKNVELSWKLPVLPFHKFNTFEKVFESGEYVSMGYKTILAVQQEKLKAEGIPEFKFAFKMHRSSINL